MCLQTQTWCGCVCAWSRILAPWYVGCEDVCVCGGGGSRDGDFLIVTNFVNIDGGGAVLQAPGFGVGNARLGSTPSKQASSQAKASTRPGQHQQQPSVKVPRVNLKHTLCSKFCCCRNFAGCSKVYRIALAPTILLADCELALE